MGSDGEDDEAGTEDGGEDGGDGGLDFGLGGQGAGGEEQNIDDVGAAAPAPVDLGVALVKTPAVTTPPGLAPSNNVETKMKIIEKDVLISGLQILVNHIRENDNWRTS